MAQTAKKYIPSKKDKIQVYEMACQGASDKAIYEFLDIDRNTFKRCSSDFSRLLKRGRREFNLHLDRFVPEIVDSLRKRCLGFEYEEVQTKQKGKVVNGQLMNGDIERTTTKKYFPPSDVAIIFFLSNRDKKNWKNSHQIDHTTLGDKINDRAWNFVIVDNKKPSDIPPEPTP